MKQAFIYSLKIWLTSVLLSPVLNIIVDKLFYPNQDMQLTGALGFIGLAIGYGLVLSIPCWIMLYLVSALMINGRLQLTHKKMLITGVGIVLCFSLFYLVFLGDDFDMETWVWALCYCGIIVAGIWYYRFDEETVTEGVEA